MPAYDAIQFEPPAPLARVTLRNPDTGKTWVDVPMLLDTGADVTMIPQDAVGLLGAAVIPDRRYELLSFTGSPSFAQVVQLELVFCSRTFRGRCLLIDQAWGILGRNVLNALSLVFDGPHLMWDEHYPG